MKMFTLFAAVLVLAAVVNGNNEYDPVAEQLLIYRDKTEKPNLLTTSSGEPVSYCKAGNTLNTPLALNTYLMDLNTRLVRERIPERVVHAKGAGAFGYFVATKDMSYMTKATFLKKGAKVPVALRFSTSVSSLGGSDLALDSRGFSVKFYTDEGNCDIVGFNTPVFTFKDPLLGNDIIHTGRRNPATNVPDPNMLWDRITLIRESLYINMILLSGRGLPSRYQNMPGFSIHTYQFVNKHGKRHFARFHFYPDDGIKTMDSDYARNLSAHEPNYLTKELYRSIANKEYPSWSVKLQILTENDVKKEGSDVFDVTRTICEKKYPLTEVGKIILNRNPKNFHAEIEQLAFCPCNIVPGVDGAPDKLYEVRTLIYRDANGYRLGGNVNKIKVNCPLHDPIFTYNRDGIAPIGDNEGDAPNYHHNSFNGPKPYLEKHCSSLLKIVEKEADNFDQARAFWTNELTTEERAQLIKNIYNQLKNTVKQIQERATKLFYEIHPDLGARVAEVLNITV